MELDIASLSYKLSESCVSQRGLGLVSHCRVADPTLKLYYTEKRSAHDGLDPSSRDAELLTLYIVISQKDNTELVEYSDTSVIRDRGQRLV